MKFSKKLLSYALAVLMVLTFIPSAGLYALAVNEPCGDNLTWTLDAAGLLTVTGSGKMYDYGYNDPVPPDYVSVETLPPWENRKAEIKEIYIDKDVETIGKRAFYNCTNLKKVTFAENSKLSTIRERAFSNCSGISAITFPAGFRYLEIEALAGTAIKEINISAEMIVTGAINFSDMPVEKFTVSPENKLYCAENGVLYNKSKTVLIAYPPMKTDAAFSIPDSVIKIGYAAFFMNNFITSVYIPATVKIADYLPFYCCEKLETVEFGEGADFAGMTASMFEGCPAIKKINIPQTSESLIYTRLLGGRYSGVEEVDLPVPITEDTLLMDLYYLYSVSPCLKKITAGGINVAEYFTKDYIVEDNIIFSKDKTRLVYALPEFNKTVYSVPEGIKVINDYAFRARTCLKEITLPASVEKLGFDVFSDCTGLEKVTFAPGIKIEEIKDSVFSNCSALTALEIPASVRKIGSSYPMFTVFRNCTSLADITFADASNLEVFYPEHFTDTPWYQNNGGGNNEHEIYSGNVLLYASNKRTYDVKEGTTKILVIRDVYNINIPASVKYIAKEAFSHCSNLRSINFDNNCHPEYVGRYALSGGSAYNGNSSYAENMKAAGQVGRILWSGKDILPNENGVIYIPDGIDVIYEGAFEGRKDIKEICFPYGQLRCICENAFKDCVNLEKIDFTRSFDLKYIGDSAFENCPKLKYADLPYNINKIGSDVFASCSSLERISFPNDGNTTDYCAENGILFNADKTELIKYPAAKADIEYIIPDTVKYISPEAFSGNTKLQKVVFPASFRDVNAKYYYENGPFNGCTSLGEVVFSPDSKIEIIGYYMFSDCSALKTIRIPDGVKAVDSTAFSGCSSLQSISLPESVIFLGVGDAIFDKTEKLSDIEIRGTNGIFYSQDGVIFEKRNNKLVYYPKMKTDKTYVVPENTKSLSAGCFSGNAYIEEITLPDNLSAIPTQAFSLCPNLKKVNISENSLLSIIMYNLCIYSPEVECLFTPPMFSMGLFCYNSEVDGEKLTLDRIIVTSESAEFEINPEVDIYAYKGSAAELIAKNNGNKFIPLESLEKVSIKNASCTEDGVIKEYYHCSINGKNFEDKYAVNEIKDISSYIVKAPGHDFTKQVIDEAHLASPATCTEKAKYYYECSVCGALSDTVFEAGETAAHTYTEKIAEDRYLKSPATLDSPAVYYFSCSVCGEASPDLTFEYGAPLPPEQPQEKPLNPIENFIKMIKDFFNRLVEFFRGLFA